MGDRSFSKERSLAKLFGAVTRVVTWVILMSLLGVDVGSTGAKAVLFNGDGAVLGQAYREYPELRPQPGWFELDPTAVWEAFTEVVAQAASHQSADPVQTMCISALGVAFTPVDAQGNFLYNTITAPDSRAGQQAARLCEALGEPKIFHITGMPPHPHYTIGKLMWMHENRPEVHAATYKYLLWPDLIFFKLGLPLRVDWSLATRTMAFDVVNKRWSQEILTAAGISPAMLPEPLRPGEVVGELSAGVAEQLNLPPGCLVVAGGHDAAMTALGAGVIHAGEAVNSMGTVECLMVAFDQPRRTEQMRQLGYCCYPHVAGDMYLTQAFNYSSGSILRWFRDNFAQADQQRAATEGRSVYEIILQDLPQGPTGLLVVPYFAGSATPYMDAQARGAMLGLTLSTDRTTFVKGLLEGTCFELRLNIEALAQVGLNVQRLPATGGGAHSPAWLQLKADITGKQVVTLNITEGGCLAGAILGGVAAGVYDLVPQAVDQLVQQCSVYEPDEHSHQQYDHYFSLYQHLWPRIRDITHQL